MSLGVLLLGGLAILLGLTHRDQVHRAELERAEEVTAVGDLRFFNMPTEIVKPPPRAAVLNGQPLYPVSYKPYELPDSRMIRVGVDAEAGISIYETAVNVPAQEGEREKADQKFYFLKLAPKEYLRVRASTPGM
jgi:hypothetical protein